MKYLINDQNEYVGIDYLGDQPNSVDVPPKPLLDHEKAVWLEDHWDYEFIDLPNIEAKFTPHGDEVISVLGMLQWCIAPGGGQKRIPKEDKISVLIPCYGKAEYIKEAVESCLSQTLKPYRIHVLLMDDESRKLHDELEAMDPCVYAQCCEQLNASAARNYLVSQCETEYFVLLDADDTMFKTFLETLYKSDASIVFGEVREEKMPEMLKGSGTLYTYCVAGQNMTFLQCKTAWNEVGGLDEELASGGEDTDYILRLFRTDWLIRKTWDSYYFYHRGRGTLTKKPEFYESQFKNVKKNLQIYREEMRRWAYEKDWFYRFMFDDRNFVSHESLQCNFYMRSTNIDLFTRDRFGKLIKAYKESRYRETDNIIETSLGPRAVDCIIHGTLSQETMDTDLDMELAEGIKVQGDTSYRRLHWLLSNKCCFIENINIYDLAKGSGDGKGKEILNRPAAFMLNKLCNRACEYCNQKGRQEYRVFDDDEIYARFDAMITKMESVGTFQVQFLGGEPTIWSEYLIKKILERTKKYPRLMIMSNHDKKDSYWEMDSRCMFYNHLIDWHGARIKPRAGDKYMIVTTHPDIPFLADFLELNKDIVIHVIEYVGDDENLQITEEDRTYVKELKLKYWWCNILINDRPLHFDDEAHEYCRQGINPWQANCLDMVFHTCCGCNQPAIQFDDFTGQLPVIEGCVGCNTVWMELHP